MKSSLDNLNEKKTPSVQLEDSPDFCFTSGPEDVKKGAKKISETKEEEKEKEKDKYKDKDSQNELLKLDRIKKGYIRTIEMLEGKISDDKHKITQLESDNEKLAKSLESLREEVRSLKKKVKETLNYNKDLECLKVSQAKVISEIYGRLAGRANLSLFIAESVTVNGKIGFKAWMTDHDHRPDGQLVGSGVGLSLDRISIEKDYEKSSGKLGVNESDNKLKTAEPGLSLKILDSISIIGADKSKTEKAVKIYISDNDIEKPKPEFSLSYLDSIFIQGFSQLKSAENLRLEYSESNKILTETPQLNQISFDLSSQPSQNALKSIISPSLPNYKKLSFDSALINTSISNTPAKIQLFSFLEIFNQRLSHFFSLISHRINSFDEQLQTLFSLFPTSFKLNQAKTVESKEIETDLQLFDTDFFSRFEELEQEILDLKETEAGNENRIIDLEEQLKSLLNDNKILKSSLKTEESKNNELSQKLENLLVSGPPPNESILDKQESTANALRSLEAIKILAETEKNYFIDHIVMIEKENSASLITYFLFSLTTELKDLKTLVRLYESCFEDIQKTLAEFYIGDYVKSIRQLVRRAKQRSSWNPFKKSLKFKEEKDSEHDESLSIVVNRLQQQLQNEKDMHLLDKKQLEGLRETLRHFEFEREIGSNELTFKNLRILIIDLFRHIPLQ